MVKKLVVNRKLTRYREWLTENGRKRGDGSWTEFNKVWDTVKPISSVLIPKLPSPEEWKNEFQLAVSNPTTKLPLQKWLKGNDKPYLSPITMTKDTWKAYKAFRLEVKELESLHALQSPVEASVKQEPPATELPISQLPAQEEVLQQQWAAHLNGPVPSVRCFAQWIAKFGSEIVHDSIPIVAKWVGTGKPSEETVRYYYGIMRNTKAGNWK